MIGSRQKNLHSPKIHNWWDFYPRSNNSNKSCHKKRFIMRPLPLHTQVLAVSKIRESKYFQIEDSPKAAALRKVKTMTAFWTSIPITRSQRSLTKPILITLQLSQTICRAQSSTSLQTSKRKVLTTQDPQITHSSSWTTRTAIGRLWIQCSTRRLQKSQPGASQRKKQVFGERNRKRLMLRGGASHR